MKTVVLLGSPSPPLIYFVNEVNKIHKVDMVLIEKSKPSPAHTQTQKKAPLSLEKILRYILFKIDAKKKIKNAKKVVEANARSAKKIFGSAHLAIDSDIPTQEVDNINGAISLKILTEIKPDLLLDHGTALLSNDIIDTAPLALNLHWGLSPYYRGVNCTQRALLNWDIHNIGVTIHKLVKKIDGGDILGQARVDVQDEDTIFSITAKKTQLGTEIVKKAIIDLQDGKQLVFKAQNTSDGYLTRKKQWDPFIQKYIEAVDPQQLQRMRKSPSRGELEIVAWK